MTKFEIADLFGVFSCDIRKAIWAIYKNKELSETDTMMTWYGAVLSNEYEITIYQTYGGAFDPSAVVTNMNPDASTDPVVLQFADFFEGGKELLLELDSTQDEARVQEIYQEVLGTIAEESLLVPFSYTREFAVWNSSKIESYDFQADSLYVDVAGLHLN